MLKIFKNLKIFLENTRKFCELLKKSKKFIIRFSLFQEQPSLIDVFLLVVLILLLKALAGTLMTVLSIAYCNEYCNLFR